MRSLLQLSLRFVSLSVLTLLVFFGGLVARFTQSDPQEQDKLAKGFGLNTARADFTTPSDPNMPTDPIQGEGDSGACETDAPESASDNPC